MSKRFGKSRFLSAFILIGDVLLINSVFFFLYFVDFLPVEFHRGSIFRQIILLLNASYVPVFYIIREQHAQRVFEMERMIRLAFYSITFHFIFFYTLVNFLYLPKLPLQFLITYYAILYVLISFWWISGRVYLKKIRLKGKNYRDIVILGAGKNGVELANTIKEDPTFGFRLLGYFDDNTGLKTRGVPLLGRVDDIYGFIEQNNVDEVYCALPDSQGERILKLLDFSEKNLVRFFIIPGYHTYLKRRIDMHTLNGVPYFSLFREPLENDLNRAIKRAFDIGFSLFVLVTIFPFAYVFAAIAIKLSSPGPIFFKQKRTGIKGEDFYCYKFRTMKVNVEADKLQAQKNDPRKTRIGELLRKTNIDELPQFFNVLKGEMSVVGPRPHMLKHTEDYSLLIDKYMIRHLIKPGITGWAQVRGYRGETKELEQMEGRVNMDVWYIENWSMWLDLKVIFLTVFNIFKGEKNAY